MNLKILNQQLVEKIKCEKSYFQFFLCAWKVLEPNTPYVDNWHIKYLCDLLEGEVRRIASGARKDQDLIVNISPRSLKSSLVTICLNAWAWTQWPELKIITASYASGLSHRHAMKTRLLIESEWYRGHWGKMVRLRRDQNRVSIFENIAGGFRKSVGVGGGVTGEGADLLIIDDPIEPTKAYSPTLIQRCKDWWSHTAQNRLNNHKVGLRILVQQRLGVDDLTGFVLEQDLGGWRHLRIPGEASYEICPPELIDFYKDDLFFPERLGKEELEKMKLDYGTTGYANQIGQHPTPVEGAIFKKPWFMNRYDVLPEGHGVMIQTWDMAFKDHNTSSFVCGQVWAEHGKNYYLVDEIRAKLDFTESLKAVQQMLERHPLATRIYIEDKANGPAIISVLRKTIPGVYEFERKDSKVGIAQSVTYYWEEGRIFLPNKSWIEDWVKEHLDFPLTRYDDRVDCSSMAIRIFNLPRRRRGVKVEWVVPRVIDLG